MTIKNLKHALERRPFRPFRVRLTSGQLVLIRDEHHAVIHPHNPKTLIIFASDGGVRILDVPLITELQTP